MQITCAIHSLNQVTSFAFPLSPSLPPSLTPLLSSQHVDDSSPLSTRWIPYSDSCEPAPDWIHSIQSHDLSSLSWLANRTILVLGDSVDRNGLQHMAEMLGLPRYCVPYDDFDKKGVVPEGWDERGIPWVVEIPWLGTYFTNGFFYGLVSQDLFLLTSWSEETDSKIIALLPLALYATLNPIYNTTGRRR